VHSQPRARRTEIAGTHGERLKIRLKSAPMDGAANEELCAFLAAAFGVPRAQVSVVNGSKSRDKTVAIRDPASLPEWASREIG
jgi:uncharacterized protein (TIGR00251 family)